jgi:hypothetical protein
MFPARAPRASHERAGLATPREHHHLAVAEGDGRGAGNERAGGRVAQALSAPGDVRLVLTGGREVPEVAVSRDGEDIQAIRRPGHSGWLVRKQQIVTAGCEPSHPHVAGVSAIPARRPAPRVEQAAIGRGDEKINGGAAGQLPADRSQTTVPAGIRGSHVASARH